MRTRTMTEIAVGIVTLLACTSAQAATITVNTDSGGTGGPDCTVRDAITAANTDTATGGCPAGSGADIIELPVGVTITLTVVDNSTQGFNGLPSVTSEITINGNGTTIERSSAAGTSDFRIFRNTSAGDLTLNNLTVTGGVAAGDVPASRGGGILNSGGTVTLNHSTVSDNSADLPGPPPPFPNPFQQPAAGGGIFNGGLLELTNSTVSGNSADGRGGGIFNIGTLTLTNSIVANSPLGGDCFNDAESVNDRGFNIVEDGGCIIAQTSMSGDPNLGPLADNGGPTQTHALLPGSIAINNGDCAGGTITEDQRGVSRPQDDFCDIGSFELECAPPQIDCPDNATIECDESSDPGNTGTPEVSEGCGEVTIDFDDETQESECPQEQTITRTWIATDENGDTATCMQTITVVDTTAPVITCPGNGSITSGDPTDPAATGMAMATDNCDNDVDIAFSDNVVFPDCQADPVHFVIERTWTATDECGNSDSCVQTITAMRQQVSLIIKQGACPAPVNAHSNGVVPMLLVGEPGFDVTTVLKPSLRVSRCECGGGEGSVPPIDGPPGPKIEVLDLNHPFGDEVTCAGPCACNTDQSGDGIDDLSMKFPTDDMVSTLPLSLGEGLVILSVTGELDAVAYPAGSINVGFVSSDCIFVVPPGAVELANAFVGSNSADTFVEITPLDLYVDSDGFTNFGRAYFSGTALTLTAPARSDGRRFVRWSINGVMQDFGVRTLEVLVEEDINLRAIYERQGRVNPDRPTEDDGDLD